MGVSFIIFGCLFSITVISGFILHNIANKVGAVSASANASVDVAAACTLTGGTDYVDELANGEYKTFGPNTLTATCNDPGGYSIYAVGYSGNTYGNNNMISTEGTTNIIPTEQTSGSSYWKMKVEGAGSSFVPTVVNSFNTFQSIPSAYTKVATYPSATSSGGVAGASQLNTSYNVNISTTQAADTYTGKVKYTLVHPNNITAPGDLWGTIASMSKGKQTLAELQTAITEPTSRDRTEDTSNSGVYEYNSAVFGEASDASSNYPIYYYRGALEPTEDRGNRGSDGKATTYPNYVLLGNQTCWRIVRTTGSGGIKMVYNGMYGATAGGSCGNYNTAASAANGPFNGESGVTLDRRYATYIGYTYNSSITDNKHTSDTDVDIVFGNNGDMSLNDADSGAKDYLENTWYADNMTDYTSMLEPAAGYCNDRTIYTDTTTSTPATVIKPYVASATTMYFGAYGRNRNATNAEKTPSLDCPRGQVDLYSATAASGGNGQLKYPVALLTLDEISFAGSGSNTPSQGSGTNSFSFLRTGRVNWTMSPSHRVSGGIYMADITANCIVGNQYVNTRTVDYRPVVSLTSDTNITGGSGTSTDPWTVESLAKSTVTFSTNNPNGISIKGNTYHNGDTVELFKGFTYNISSTVDESYYPPTWQATSGVFAEPTNMTTAYTVGNNATITLNLTARPTYTITFATNNATGINVRGTTYTGGSSMTMYGGLSYNIGGEYAARYAFSSWSATSGTIADSGSENTTYTPSGNATLTLNGRYATTVIQDFTLSQCQSQATSAPALVYDRRDNSAYTVRYINGNCWMTQNLRITGTISATDSNFSSPASFDVSAGGDLRGGSDTSTTAKSHRADSTDTAASGSLGYTIDQLGAWYNYCAASAGEICQEAVKQDATQDICPAGWYLPSYSQQNGIRSYASSFSPIYGGIYYSGSLNTATTQGSWWSATSYDAIGNQYSMYYSTGSLGISTGGKSSGRYIRCVRSS